jgi:hypothetical protein
MYLSLQKSEIENKINYHSKRYVEHYCKSEEEKIHANCKKIKDIEEREDLEAEALNLMYEKLEKLRQEYSEQAFKEQIQALLLRKLKRLTNENFVLLRQDLIHKLVINQKRLYKLKKHFPRELLEDQINKGEIDNYRRAQANYKSHLNERLSNRTINNSVNGKVHTKLSLSINASKYNAKIKNYWDNAQNFCEIARFYPLGKNASYNHKESIRSMFIYAIDQIREKLYQAIISNSKEQFWMDLLNFISDYEDLIRGIPDPDKHLTLQRIPIEKFTNFIKVMEIYDIFEFQYKFAAIPLRKKKIVEKISKLIKLVGINTDRIYAKVDLEAKMYYIAYQNKYSERIDRFLFNSHKLEVD